MRESSSAGEERRSLRSRVCNLSVEVLSPGPAGPRLLGRGFLHKVSLVRALLSLRYGRLWEGGDYFLRLSAPFAVVIRFRVWRCVETTEEAAPTRYYAVSFEPADQGEGGLGRVLDALIGDEISYVPPGAGQCVAPE